MGGNKEILDANFFLLQCNYTYTSTIATTHNNAYLYSVSSKIIFRAAVKIKI